MLPPGAGGDAVPGAAFPLARLAGCQLDHHGLLAGGLPGLRQRLAARREAGGLDAEGLALCEGWDATIDAYAACLDDLAQRAELAGAVALAADCRHLMAAAPATLAQAIQLLWLWDAGAGLLNHGRIDDDLAPFLGDEAEAEILLAEWWCRIAERATVFNGRVCLGGRGRRQPQAADRLARIALRVTAAHAAIEPQVSLRLDRDQDPALLDAALDALARGCTYPILYWDEQVVPHVAAAHRIGMAAAERWLPYGCGETVLLGAGTASPNGIANAARILEEVLFGLPAGSRRAPGAEDLARAPAFADAESVWTAFAARADAAMAALAQWQAHTHAVAGAACRFLPLSLLADDCLSRGRAVLDGGIRQHGGTMELYGLADAGDSLAALETVVFAPGGCGLDSLRRALLADFRGFESLRARLLRAPAYGNDDAGADRWTRRVHRSVCDSCRRHGAEAGLDHFLVVVINNWVNTVFGRRTGALPSGRLAGKPLANANNPQPGRDRQGPVALLRSLAGLERGLDAGCVQHLKLSRAWFAGDRTPLRALLAGYAAVGGMQVMITTSDPGELQAALREPAAYGHLMVRVGGFSARFVDLPRDCQEEICARSLH
jgi:pyruvate-formate lyase